MTEPVPPSTSIPLSPITTTPVPARPSASEGRAGEVTPGDGGPQRTMYELVGGHDFFQRLVDEFYAGVAEDAPLRALYPEQDLGPAADRLRMFLEQYWGGPHTYHEQRGHPRLRIRHAPFAVTPTQRDRWLHHMGAALDAQHLPADLHRQMWAYLSGAAQFLVNAQD